MDFSNPQMEPVGPAQQVGGVEEDGWSSTNSQQIPGTRREKQVVCAETRLSAGV